MSHRRPLYGRRSPSRRQRASDVTELSSSEALALPDRRWLVLIDELLRQRQTERAAVLLAARALAAIDLEPATSPQQLLDQAMRACGLDLVALTSSVPWTSNAPNVSDQLADEIEQQLCQGQRLDERQLRDRARLLLIGRRGLRWRETIAGLARRLDLRPSRIAAVDHAWWHEVCLALDRRGGRGFAAATSRLLERDEELRAQVAIALLRESEQSASHGPELLATVLLAQRALLRALGFSRLRQQARPLWLALVVSLAAAIGLALVWWPAALGLGLLAVSAMIGGRRRLRRQWVVPRRPQARL